ncbi:hypothetical protein ABIE52_001337 [Rhodococcus sp. OAS809]|uniref:hypothetical protein n=1 Tax=Rhodococcus sp. OAS809 TaxID=2663874 RepID=UPI00178ACBD5
MPSTLFVSFEQEIKVLKQSLIADSREDFRYTPEEHKRALGFRVLASAHLEHFLEERCLQIASKAAADHKSGTLTRASKCLVVWYAVTADLVIPIDNGELANRDHIDKAFEKYRKVVTKSHGINGAKLKGLLIPIGFRDAEMSAHSSLFNQLDSVADNRNPAAHTVVKRAMSLVAPEQEWTTIDNLMRLLVPFDADVGKLI